MDVPKNKLIVALDVPTIEQARELVALLRSEVGMFKVGSQLFTAVGPDFVREIVKSGVGVFLDLKFHDIPNTVAAAAVEATRLGVTLLNIHAAGGPEMMQRTADSVTDVAAREGLQRPSVIAVTVLTSSDEAMLLSTGIKNSAADQVTKLALLAEQSGMDGLVASPLEVPSIRTLIKRRDFLIVTPGIRPSGPFDDRNGLRSGRAISRADYLVVAGDASQGPSRGSRMSRLRLRGGE